MLEIPNDVDYMISLLMSLQFEYLAIRSTTVIYDLSEIMPFEINAIPFRSERTNDFAALKQ